MENVHFPNLFRPGKIGKLEIRNRIVLAPMATGFEDSDGSISQREIDYFVARAKGGTGLIMTGAARVDRNVEPPATWTVPWMDSDMNIAKASDLAEAVHDYGAKICLQISAGLGRQADWASPTKIPVAPSPLPSYINPTVICHELTKGEIRKIIQAHAEAAVRIAVAGFDMVELHAHTGYLIDEFMTPLWNKRKDEYGGSFENRMRFPLEIIAAIRKAAPGLLISFRLSLEHKMPGGRTIPEGIKIAERVEAAGVDVIHVDGGSYDAMPYVFPPSYYPEGVLINLAAAVKKSVKIPVITVGKIQRPELAERIIAEGQADFVALGRQLIADPEWANKARGGRVEDIRPCIVCNEFCIGREFSYKPVACSVNVTAGKERYYSLTPAEKKKKVIVIGGGPAGMEAARIAALRGHRVTLYEKERLLGGQLNAASKPPFKVELARLVKYLSVQLEKLGVKMELGTEVTPQFISLIKPDTVIVAIGANPFICRLPGVDNPNVITAIDLDLGKVTAGKTVIVAGGGLTGCDTALNLAQQGKKVTIVEMLPEIARDLNSVSRQALLEKIAESKIHILTEYTIKEFTENGLVAVDKTGRKHSIRSETIVLALGSKPDNALNSIRDRMPEVYFIGDCVLPRKIGEAIHEGYVTGWKI